MEGKQIIAFIKHCKFEKNLSDKTIKAYSIDLKQFYTFIDSKRIDAFNVNKDIIREYVQILSMKFKVKTVKRKIASLKTFFSFLIEDGFINNTPFSDVKISLKEPLILPRTLSLDEIECIFNNAYDQLNCENNPPYIKRKIIRDLLLLEFLFSTGLRVSEISNLKNTDVDIKSGRIKVNGKGNKQRILYISNSEILNLLSSYFSNYSDDISNCGYFFVNRLHTRLSEQSIRQIVYKYCTVIDKKITPHQFRHTFATALLDEGVDILIISKLLGHSSISTTQIYTHVSNRKSKQVLNDFHPRNRMQYSNC